MATITFTMSDTEVRLALMALREWDGWDGDDDHPCISDAEEDVRWELVRRLAEITALRSQFCTPSRS